MKIRIRFSGRRQGALGISYDIGLFEGEGPSAVDAIDAARMMAYRAGFENVHPATLRAKGQSVPTRAGWQTEYEPVYEVLP